MLLNSYFILFFLRIYSGDGTLSVMDIRSKKPDPVAHSEDQEDELLSVVAIKGLVDFLSFYFTNLEMDTWGRKWSVCGDTSAETNIS